MAKAKKRVTGGWTYIPESDRALPPNEQTVFHCKPLTSGERERLADESIQRVIEGGSIRVVSRMRSLAREIFLTNVTAIDRFPSDAPKAWPEKPDQRADYIEDMEDDLVFEVGNQIYDRSSFGPEITKPDDPPSERQIVGES